MGSNRAPFPIQKSHLQDRKRQMSQSLFAVWVGDGGSGFIEPPWESMCLEKPCRQMANMWATKGDNINIIS